MRKEGHRRQFFGCSRQTAQAGAHRPDYLVQGCVQHVGKLLFEDSRPEMFDRIEVRTIVLPCQMLDRLLYSSCMKRTERVPPVASTPLPELAAFLKPFHLHFLHGESRHLLDSYVTDLLRKYPNKNCETVAKVIPASLNQSLQGLLTTMCWESEALNWQRVKRLAALDTAGDAVLVLDNTDCIKKGGHSIGVARQYIGTVGKVCICPCFRHMLISSKQADTALIRRSP